MDARFTSLEQAVLRAIAGANAEIGRALLDRFDDLADLSRRNSGSGFFTEIAVKPSQAPMDSHAVLGQNIHADIAGLEHGLGFVLFFDNGQPATLEGYSFGEDTSKIDLHSNEFRLRCEGTSSKSL